MGIYTSILIFYEQTDTEPFVFTTIVTQEELNFLNKINRKYRGIKLIAFS